MMKRLLILLSIATALILSGCGSEDSGHSHGEEGDHTHAPETQQQAPHEGEAEGDTPSAEEEHTQSEESDHQHEAEDHSHEGEPQEDHSHGSEDEHQHDADADQEESGGSVTQWTDKTELFMEYPEIVTGRQVTFTVHLTRLSDFEAVSDSEVRFMLRSEQGTRLTATEKQPSDPGIYEPEFTFEEAGQYDMTILINGMVDDTLQVQDIQVSEAAGGTSHLHEEDNPNLVTFLKEQQWEIPFGTQNVSRRTLTRTVDARGEITAAQNSQAVVSAPFSGIILPSQNSSLPVEGQQLQKGHSLAVLNPAIQSGDGDNYVQQFINARSELELAESELQRSRRLLEKEAIPESEHQQARIAYRRALTRFQTINEVIQVDTAAIDGYGESTESFRFELKAPLSGTLVESFVTPGMQVEAGEPLYRIADASKVWLKAHVPAAQQAKVANAGDAAFRVQGDEQLYEVSKLGGQLVSRGNSVDPQSRTLTLTYAFNNANHLPLGMFSTVHIDTETSRDALAIPGSALIEEEGTYYVYVHVSGESFEKRRITTGINDRGWVEVTSGLDEGERVVSKNAYQVKLASLSSEAPAHGHTH